MAALETANSVFEADSSSICSGSWEVASGKFLGRKA